jgi:hypothetical protein
MLALRQCVGDVYELSRAGTTSSECDMNFHEKSPGEINGHVSDVEIIEGDGSRALRISIDVVFPYVPDKFCIDVTADCPFKRTMNLLIVADDKELDDL